MFKIYLCLDSYGKHGKKVKTTIISRLENVTDINIYFDTKYIFPDISYLSAKKLIESSNDIAFIKLGYSLYAMLWVVFIAIFLSKRGWR